MSKESQNKINFYFDKVKNTTVQNKTKIVNDKSIKLFARVTLLCIINICIDQWKNEEHQGCDVYFMQKDQSNDQFKTKHYSIPNSFISFIQ